MTPVLTLKMSQELAKKFGWRTAKCKRCGRPSPLAARTGMCGPCLDLEPPRRPA